MKKILLTILIAYLISCSKEKSEPIRNDKIIELEFSSFFAPEEKFNFNPSVFWGTDTEKKYQISVDAAIGTDNKDRIFILSYSNLLSIHERHVITIIDTLGKIKYKKNTIPAFTPTDLVGTVNNYNEFIFSEINELPGIFIIGEDKDKKYPNNGKVVMDFDQKIYRPNKMTNNLNYDLLFQYDSWDYLEDKFTHIGIFKNNSFSKIDLPIENKISAVTFDSKNNIWAIDYNNSKITVLDSKGKILNTFQNKYGLNKPFAIASNHNNLIFIGDTGNNRIVVLDESGNLKTTFGNFGIEKGQFNIISDLCYLKNKLYIIDKTNNRIQVLNVKMK